MRFEHVLKGKVVEVIIGSLLRHAGYAVVASSVETLFPSLPHLTADQYASLRLGAEIRLMPDLLLLPAEGQASEIEIKYRTSLSREVARDLAAELRTQQQHFPDTHTVIVRGVAPAGTPGGVDDHIRVLAPRTLELFAAADLFYHTCTGPESPADTRLEPMWQAMRPITSVWSRLRDHRDALERVVPLCRALAAL